MSSICLASARSAAPVVASHFALPASRSALSASHFALSARSFSTMSKNLERLLKENQQFTEKTEGQYGPDIDFAKKTRQGLVSYQKLIDDSQHPQFKDDPQGAIRLLFEVASRPGTARQYLQEEFGERLAKKSEKK